MVRGRGHGDQQRAAECNACARQSSRRARRATTFGSSARSRGISAVTGPNPSPKTCGTSCGRSRPMHRGMSYARLEELGGIQWPCLTEDSIEPSYLHGRLWADDPAERGKPAAFSVVEHELPVDQLDRRLPHPPHDRPPPRQLQHRCAERRDRLAAPSRWRDHRPVARRCSARSASPTAGPSA